MSDVGDQGERLNRVEGEVSLIRTDMGALSSDVSLLKADVKSFGGILGRIEEGVLRAEDKTQQREIANKPNLVAVISILITIISILIGGAWTISASLSRSDERHQQQTRFLDGMISSRNRELDRTDHRLDRIEDRLDAKK